MLFCRLLASGIGTITVSLRYGIASTYTYISAYGHERVKIVGLAKILGYLDILGQALYNKDFQIL